MKLTESHIRAFIAEPYVSRGREYYAEGAVQLISFAPEKVTAKARGTKI